MNNNITDRGAYMTALFMILSAIAITGLGYIFYGKYLSKQWDVNDSHITPAHSMKDGMDYVPASEIVVFGHHFSSIAGAGPINGPILATAFGWLPVMLWCIIGGIFVGGVHDFGSLLASLRNKGESVGNIIGKSMSLQVKKMFLIFAIIVALLGTASFISVICGSFATSPDENGVIVRGLVANPTAGQTAAFVSVCFGLIAIFFGMMMRRTKVSLFPATVIGLVMVALCIWAGLY